jgi:DNA-binding response OmpR family regulator
MAAEKILIIDDDKDINALIASYLTKEGFIPISAFEHASALSLIAKEKPDLIILDVMMPEIDGVELCLEIRKKYHMPILFLSCKAEEIDKIISLSVGGDDYITKPFLPGELVARIKAHLRRVRISASAEEIEEVFNMPGLTINFTSREVFADGKPIALSIKELELLKILIHNPKRIFSMNQLFEMVWQTNSLEGDSRTIMVYISNLRKKIETNPDNPKYIISVRGVGYKFNHSIL